MHSGNPQLSVIIPTKDREQILINHLYSLLDAAKDFKIQIIVVNDGTQPLSQIPKDERIEVVSNLGQGVASARNLGAYRAMADIILFLDDDMVVFRENIKAIINFHKHHENCFLNLNWVYPPETLSRIKETVFGRYLISNHFTKLKGWNRGNFWDDNQIFETNGITSQNLSVRREVFIASGGYNGNYPFAGFEDYDYSQRIIQKGYKIYIEPAQLTWHNEADRLNLKSWLNRKYSGGITRRVAVAYGHDAMRLSLTIFKKLAIIVFTPIQPLVASLIHILNSRIFDLLSFKIIDHLLTFSIYQGYCSKEAKILVNIKLNRK